jgi:hypothetical protein
VHPADFGVPSELAWVALFAGLLYLRTDAPRARGLLALGVVWGAIALLVPEPHLATLPTALGDALTDPLRALTALALLAALGLGAYALVTRGPLPVAVAAAIRPLGAGLLALTALGGFTTGAPLAALTTALTLASLVLLARHVLVTASPRAARVVLAATLVATITLWLLLKSQALIASNTDENIYFYMAKLLGDGKLPYRDYFFAHPPLHVLVPGAVFAVFGFSLTLAKLFPMVAALVGGLAVWGIARRAISPWAAPLALVLYLFASEVLKASSNMTGVNMTTMWLALGLWQMLKGRPATAGALLGCAVTTGFYAMAPALAIVAMAFFWAPDPDAPAPARRGFAYGLRLALSFALVVGATNAIFYAIGGERFLKGVYAYHQQKSFEDPDMVELFGADPGFPASLFHNLGVMVGGNDFVKDVFYHAYLWVAALALPLVVVASWLRFRGRAWRMLLPTTLFRSGPDGRALVVALVALALFVEFAMFRELYSFYFALLYPFLALCAAYVIWRGIDLVARVGDATGRPLGARASAALAFAAVIGLGLHGVVSHVNRGIFDDELEKVGGRNDYTWTDPPVLASFGGITKELFWEGSRLKADDTPGYRYYLWQKKRAFSVLDDVVAHVRAGSTADETITGASTLAPLVALLADRRMAADEIDTNQKRFAAGLLREDDFWRRVCDDKVRFVVGLQRSWFGRERMSSSPIASTAFTLDRVFEDRTLQYNAPLQIALYRRVDGVPCAAR